MKISNNTVQIQNKNNNNQVSFEKKFISLDNLEKMSSKVPYKKIYEEHKLSSNLVDALLDSEGLKLARERFNVAASIVTRIEKFDYPRLHTLGTEKKIDSLVLSFAEPPNKPNSAGNILRKMLGLKTNTVDMTFKTANSLDTIQEVKSLKYGDIFKFVEGKLLNL